MHGDRDVTLLSPVIREVPSFGDFRGKTDDVVFHDRTTGTLRCACGARIFPVTAQVIRFCGFKKASGPTSFGSQPNSVLLIVDCYNTAATGLNKIKHALGSRVLRESELDRTCTHA